MLDVSSSSITIVIIIIITNSNILINPIISLDNR